MTVVELIERLKRENSLATVYVVKFDGCCVFQRGIEKVQECNQHDEQRVDLHIEGPTP